MKSPIGLTPPGDRRSEHESPTTITAEPTVCGSCEMDITTGMARLTKKRTGSAVSEWPVPADALALAMTFPTFVASFAALRNIPTHPDTGGEDGGHPGPSTLVSYSSLVVLAMMSLIPFLFMALKIYGMWSLDLPPGAHMRSTLKRTSNVLAILSLVTLSALVVARDTMDRASLDFLADRWDAWSIASRQVFSETHRCCGLDGQFYLRNAVTVNHTRDKGTDPTCPQCTYCQYRPCEELERDICLDTPCRGHLVTVWRARALLFEPEPLWWLAVGAHIWQALISLAIVYDHARLLRDGTSRVPDEDL